MKTLFYFIFLFAVIRVIIPKENSGSEIRGARQKGATHRSGTSVYKDRMSRVIQPANNTKDTPGRNNYCAGGACPVKILYRAPRRRHSSVQLVYDYTGSLAEGKINGRITYSVNIISSPTRIPLWSSVFKEYENVSEYYHNGSFKYAVGAYSSREEAEEMFVELLEKGYNGAFPVAFYSYTDPELQ